MSSSPLAPFSLIAATDAHMCRPQIRRPRKPAFYPSEASVKWVDSYGIQRVSGACIRASFLRFTGKGKDYAAGFTPYNEWIFALGKAVEIILVEQYKQMGIWVGNNIEFYDSQRNISGEIDILLKDPNSKLFIGECCTPETAILTTEGRIVPIQEIHQKDQVIGHKNQDNIISNIMIRIVKDEIVYKFCHKADGLDGWFTKKHPILTAEIKISREIKDNKTRKYKVIHTSFKNASEVCRGDYICIPKIRSFSSLDYATLGRYDFLNQSNDWQYEIKDGQVIRGKRRGNSRYMPIPSQIHNLKDFYWLLGLYIAEGSCSSHCIYFSLNEKEVDIVSRIKDTVSNIFGISNIRVRNITKDGEKTKGINVSISNIALRNLFKNIVPGNTKEKTKYVKYHLISEDPELLRSFLDGIWKGDGCTSTIEKNKGEQYKITTAVPDLAVFYFQIAAYCGFHPRLKKYQQQSQMNSEWIYAVEWATGGEKGNIEKLIDAGDFWCYKVKKVKQKLYSGEVYNFETNSDHTYTAAGILTHNCKSFYGYMATKEICGGKGQAGRPKASHLMQLMIYLDQFKDLVEYGKLVYYARDSAKRNEFDITLVENSSKPGAFYPTVNGIMDCRFSLQDIYARYEELNHWIKLDEMPPPDYEKVWSKEKVEERYKIGDVSKTSYADWMKNPKANPIGDWNCPYCQYEKVCWPK